MVETLLTVEDVSIYYAERGGVFERPLAWVKAVDGVTLSIARGDTLGLVGESGCGKTTLVNGILLLEPLTAGVIRLDGHDLSSTKGKELRQLRRSMQVVFQDPFWSLNPRWLVRDIVAEPLAVHEHLNARERAAEVVRILELVGLEADALFKYPHEFSAGMRQRIAIGRALALGPKLVILDEPTSAIDVLSQHQILAMLSDLKEQLNLTYILVSHDLSVVRYLANKLAVMYLGKLAEWGDAQAVFDRPSHPYTQALFAAIPNPEAEGVEHLISLSGEVPSALSPPAGCRFHTRCPEVMAICSREEPPVVAVADGHWATCWLLHDSGDARS